MTVRRDARVDGALRGDGTRFVMPLREEKRKIDNGRGGVWIALDAAARRCDLTNRLERIS
jgi:hypothetical protein